MPYNPSVATGINATPVQIAPTLNTMANIDLAQAHSGLYQLQALQQQRQLNALQAAAAAYRSGKDPVGAYLSEGGDPAGSNTLQNVFFNQRAAGMTPGGVLPGAYEQMTGANKNIQETKKAGIETQASQVGLAAKIAGGVINSQGTDDNAWRTAVETHYNTFGGPTLEKQQLLAIKDPAQRVQIARAYSGQGTSTDVMNTPHQIQPGEGVYTAAGVNQPAPTQPNKGPQGGPLVAPLSPRQKAQQTSEADATTKYLQEDGHKAYSNAQALMGSMVNVDHDVDTLGPAWMGTGATAKASFVKGVNSVLAQFGGEPINGDKVATSEELGKETIRAGMQLINSNFGGSREAASIIQMGGKAVVGQQNSYLGAKYVSATIKAAAQRQIDLYEYQADHSDQLPAKSEVQFNKLHPPQQYAMGGIASVIPQQAKDILAQHPETAPTFNKHFGSGMAEFILGSGK